MLSYKVRELLKENAAGERKWYVEGHCLAADTKPTEGIANGSCLIEMDGDVCFFDEENSEWVAFGGGGS